MDKTLYEIIDSKMVWVAWSNTDCTEGRGHSYPYVVADCKATALRLGKGKHVQGSDCPVTEHIALKVNNGGKVHWYVPREIQGPSKEDRAAETKRKEQQAVIDKALQAGLTTEDLEKIMGD